MSGSESIEHFLLHGEIPHEQVDSTTWFLRLDDSERHAVVLRIQSPICLVSAQIARVTDETHDREGLYRTLLQLNAEMLHCSYALQGDQIVLSGAHQLENLDKNEFQALLDDLAMALDNHHDALRPWTDRK